MIRGAFSNGYKAALLVLEVTLVQGLLCLRSKSLSGKREGFQDNAIRKNGSSLLTRVSAPAATNAMERGHRALSPRCYPNLQSIHKQLVAGLSGLVTCFKAILLAQTFVGFFQTWVFAGFSAFP